MTPLHGLRLGGGEARPGLLLVTPAVAAHTAAVFAAWADGAMASPGVAARSSEHFASEFGSGLTAHQLLERAGVLAAANDLLPAAAAVVEGLVPFRRALMRLLARPIGLSGSGPTLWALYPSLDDADLAASSVRAAVSTGFVDGTRRRPAVRRGDDVPDHRPRREERPMIRQAIQTNGAPAPVGPYSQAIVAGDLVFCSGQVGLDPATGELVDGLEAQAERALRNLVRGARRGRRELGRRREDDDLPRRRRRLRRGERDLREGHARSAARPFDGRRSGLPKGALVEIEAIARRSVADAVSERRI